MKNLTRKINTLILWLKRAVIFSPLYVFFCIMSGLSILKKVRLGSLWRYFIDKKAQYIYNYLDRNFGEVIKNHNTETTPSEELKIWVFWAQGMESAPELVRMCNEQLQRTNPGRVVNLSMQNLGEYIDIPNHVQQGVKSGKITLTFFSDIVRVSLLAKHGGIWLDSTCFVTENLIDKIAQNTIFTLTSTHYSPKHIPQGRWTIWAIGTDQKNHPLFVLSREIFFKYFEKNNILIDYFLVDHTLNYIYQNCEMTQQQLKAGAINGDNRFLLAKSLDQEYKKEDLEQILSCSPIFKLSYKTKKKEQTKSCKPTIYAHLKGVWNIGKTTQDCSCE